MLVGGERQPLRVVDCRTSRDAVEEVEGDRVGAVDISTVIGDHGGQTETPGQGSSEGVGFDLALDACVLEFEVEALRPENRRKLLQVLQGSLVAILAMHRGSQRAVQAAGEAHQSFRMLLQQLVVDARTVVHAFEDGPRDQRTEVLVAGGLLVCGSAVRSAFDEQRDVEPGVRFTRGQLVEPRRPQPDGGAQDEVQPRSLGGLPTLEGTVEIAGIGERHRWKFQLGHPTGEVRWTHRAVEQTVLTPRRQVHETHHHLRELSRSRSAKPNRRIGVGRGQPRPQTDR